VAAETWLEPQLGIPPAESWGSRYLGPARLLRVLGIVLVPPVAEELIFRGALFTNWSGRGCGPGAPWP
jgi:membrane protease YdiL (CAAX protease family)